MKRFTEIVLVVLSAVVLVSAAPRLNRREVSHVQESTVLGEAEEAVKSLFAKETWDKVLLKAQNVEQGVEKGLDDGTDIVKGVFTDDHWKKIVEIAKEASENVMHIAEHEIDVAKMFTQEQMNKLFEVSKDMAKNLLAARNAATPSPAKMIENFNMG